MQKVLLSVASLVVASSLTACFGGSTATTPEPPKYPDYREIQLGDDMWEVRFTDSEGVKMRCFVYVGYQKGGLDGCEKVG